MAQDGTTAGGASYTLDNVTFPVGRSKLQSIFDAIRSTNIGNTAPDLVAGQFWIDNNTPSTTVWTMYFYDGTDSIQFATIDTINNTVNFIDSTFDLVNDTTPQLGGTLDANGNTIDMGTNTITDTKVGQWDTAYSWGDHSTQGYLTSETDSQTLSFSSPNLTISNGNSVDISGITSGYLQNLSEDSTPQLGGNLDLNSNDITGTGNIDISGNASIGTSTAGILNLRGGSSTSSQIRFFDGGTARARIGVPTGQTYLSLSGSDSLTSDFLISSSEVVANESSNDQDFRVESDTNTHALFVDGGTDRVGIGTGSPTSALTIYNSSVPQISFGYNATQSHNINWDSSKVNINVDPNNDNASSDFSVNIDGTRHLTLLSDGKLGIGTNSPSANLQVVGTGLFGTNSSGSAYANTGVTVDDGTATGRYGFTHFGATNRYVRMGVPNSSFCYFETNTTGGYNFDNKVLFSGSGTFNESSNDQDFRVESNNNTHALFVDGGTDNVGISSSSPGAKLDITKTHTSTDLTAANSNSILRLHNAGTGNGVYQAIKFSGNQQDMYIMSLNNNNQNSRRFGFFVGSVAGDATSDERLSIMGSGNVGIGTTGASQKLDVNGNIRSQHHYPASTNTYDLGSSSLVWRNIYTSDFHMSNEGLDKGNDIDGTKGSWTFQEGEENLYLINNKNGKKYKFNLTEVA